MKTNFKNLKIANGIRQILAQKILDETEFYKSYSINILHVDLSPDMHFAKVFITVRNSIHGKDAVQTLNALTKQFRKEIAKKLKLRKVPEIYFIFDEDKMNLSNILDNIHTC